jgi:hypothetical protein
MVAATVPQKEADMDEARYDELMAKREKGLNDDEANELGRLIAEKEGVPYEGHGPNAAEADEEADERGRHKEGSPDPVEEEGEIYQYDERTKEIDSEEGSLPY